jgi:hypothetical protein
LQLSPLFWLSEGEMAVKEAGWLEQLTESREKASRLFRQLEEVRGFL